MKTIYKSTLLLALGCFTMAANAQKDTTYNRQIMLERDYTPTLKDASKINTTPALYEPTMIKKDARFLEQAPQISLNSNLLGAAKPGDIKTNVDFDKKRGYIGLGAGSNSNLEGVAGIRILNSDSDQLDLFANHSSTSGNVDYLEKGYWYKEAKAKYSDTKVSLKYAHTFDPSVLSFRTSFFNTSYNYYGNSFLDPEIYKSGGYNGYGGYGSTEYPFDLGSRQNVDVFSIGAGLRSTDNNKGLLKYMFSLDYRNFKNKYGPRKDDKGAKGGQFDLGVDFYTEFDSDKILGVKGSLMNQSVSDVKFATFDDAFHSFTNITVTPYFNFIGESWDASLGLNVNSLFDVKTKFLVSPNISAGVNVTEDSRFYANIGGGVNNNTILDILQENRYVDPIARVDYSRTYYDLNIGFKSGALTGFEFDIFGGYKHTKRDHLYTSVVGNTYYSWGNVSTPLYANISTGHAGAQIKTSLIPYTDLSAKLTGYFYSIKYNNGFVSPEKKAFGRPSFTAELNADVKVIPQFTFSLNYMFAGGRKTLVHDITTQYSSVKMKDINELNLRAEYQITDWAAVYVKANNVLFQKYENIYGYALQGGNFMGGLNFKF